MADSPPDTPDRPWLIQGIAPGGGRIKPIELPEGPSELVRGVRIVDTDTHFSEAPDLWTSRAPAAYRDRVPQVRRVGEIEAWFVGDVPLGPIGPSVIAKNDDKLTGKISFPRFEPMNPAAWQVAPRLEVMDRFGIWAQICYQNCFLSSDAFALAKIEDPDLRLAVVKIANDAYAERQVESGNRLFTQAVLPFWDAELMAEEARRCIEDLGLTGFVLADRPESRGLPGFLDPHWAPLFELCDDRGVPINFHIGTNIDGFEFTWGQFGYETQLAIAGSLFFLGNAATLANFLMSGLFDRYRGLKIVSVESGLGWIPFLLETLEHQLDEMMPTDGRRLERRPTEYFRDHVYASYWFEEHGPRSMLEEIGIGNVLFETDYPHPTSLYPKVAEKIEATLGHLDPASRKRILQDNAVELYGLPV